MAAITKLSIVMLGAAAIALGSQRPLPANAINTSQAGQQTPQQTATQPNQTPVLLAQFTCLPGGSELVEFFETDNFQVLICRKAGKLYYHGIERGGDRNGITLPAYYEEGTGYVAENGEYAYIINRSTLSIYQGNTLLQRDRVYDR